MAEGFNRERFDALVLYIAHRRRDDARFGRTKLAKTLFFSDFESYQIDERPLTGATYIRLPHGPFPKQLGDAETRLAQDGYVFPDYLKEEGEEKRLIPLKPFPHEWARRFDEGELALVNRWIEHVSSASTRRISELSHDHPGWILAEATGAEIPYRTAILPYERPSPIQAERAKELARERGWLFPNGEWIWERDPSV
jgi:hypothetical protein